MIAHYGYQDAEGAFFVTIDTEACTKCAGRPCIAACPRGLFVAEEDPYGDLVVAIDDRKRNRLKHECAECKPGTGRRALACVAACPCGAIAHSW